MDLTLRDFLSLFQSAGPWAVVLVMWFMFEKRFEAVKRMYENNVELVRDFNKLSQDQQDLIIMNTQAVTRLIEKIDQNQYCPAARVEKRTVEVAG